MSNGFEKTLLTCNWNILMKTRQIADMIFDSTEWSFVQSIKDQSHWIDWHSLSFVCHHQEALTMPPGDDSLLHWVRMHSIKQHFIMLCKPTNSEGFNQTFMRGWVAWDTRKAGGCVCTYGVCGRQRVCRHSVVKVQLYGGPINQQFDSISITAMVSGTCMHVWCHAI